MPLAEDLDSYALQLYRFACALISGRPGPCPEAASLVRAAMAPVLGRSLTVRLKGDNLRLSLYAALIQKNHGEAGQGQRGAIGRRLPHNVQHNVHVAAPNGGANTSMIAQAPDRLAAALLDLKLDEREALLLVALEGFTYAQAARILKVPQDILAGRLARARAALGRTLPCDNAVRPARSQPSYLRVVK